MKAFADLGTWARARLNRPRKSVCSNQIHLDHNGLLQWAPHDAENPKEWSRNRRWYTTFAAIIIVMNDLGVSTEIASLTVTLFLLGYVAGPCLWAPLSEFYGRRPVLHGTFVSYFAFTFLCAFSPNITGLLLGRFLTGMFISGAIANTPGIFADIWGPIERGNSMMLFTSAMQMGPAIGPLLAGFYQLKLNWRWTFYQSIWVAAFSILILPTIPETLPAQALKFKAQRIRAAKIPGFERINASVEVDERTLIHIFKVALTRPWQILFDPIAFLITLYISVVYTLLYMLFTIFPIVFIEERGWNSGVGQLPLLSICVGAILAGVYSYYDSIRQRRKLARGHAQRPEDTLCIAMVGGIIFPAAMFALAWSGQFSKSVHWMIPTLAGGAISIAICLLFVGFLGYLSESYLMYAASAQAANTIVRSAIAAGAPLYTEQMFRKLGVGPGGSLIGGIAVLLAPIPFIFHRYGGKIRQSSKFAPSPAANEAPARRVLDEEKAQHCSESRSIVDSEEGLDVDEKKGKTSMADVSSVSIAMIQSQLTCME